MKYAVFSSGGKQHLVSEGDSVLVEKLDIKKSGPVEFDKVLLSTDGKKIDIGKPYISHKIKATVEEQIKSSKIKVYKYKAKTGYHKTQGHRQRLTKVKIIKV